MWTGVAGNVASHQKSPYQSCSLHNLRRLFQSDEQFFFKLVSPLFFRDIDTLVCQQISSINRLGRFHVPDTLTRTPPRLATMRRLASILLTLTFSLTLFTPTHPSTPVLCEEGFVGSLSGRNDGDFLSENSCKCKKLLPKYEYSVIDTSI